MWKPTMDLEDLAKEIERRKQIAKDLKLRELLWKLYNSHLSNYTHTLSRDPGSIYPSLKDSISIQGDNYFFTIGEAKYEVAYTAGKERSDAGYRDWGRIVTTPFELSLNLECRCVFEFKMTKTVEDTEDGPIFNERIGDITAFIEGPWVPEFTTFVQNVEQYKRQFWDQKNAVRREQKLKAEKKRFGL
jgi:hypothetical protein